MWIFEHTEITNAPPHAVWLRWVAVSDWPKQNPIAASAQLNGPFQVGTTISFKPKKGPKSTLVLVEVTEDKSFAASSNIPLGKMRIEHVMQPRGNQTEFKHKIIITGPFNRLFAKLAGEDMAAALPQMMQTIANEAENS